MAGRGPVGELFAQLLPPRAGIATLAIEGAEPPLYTVEEPAVARAVAKRRREFAFGRACARGALAELGREPVALPAADGGAPIWPPDLAGSITHTNELAAAAVVPVDTARALGIDLESVAHAARTPSLLATVTTADERVRFATLSALPLAALVFSAKESVYKCLYPLGRHFLDFSDVELVIDPAGRFTVLRARGYAEHDVRALRGSFACSDALVATVAIVHLK